MNIELLISVLPMRSAEYAAGILASYAALLESLNLYPGAGRKVDAFIGELARAAGAGRDSAEDEGGGVT